jgi:hypothetical protein
VATRELENANLEVAFLKRIDMVTPKFRKGMDTSQIARAVVVYATAAPLTPRKSMIKEADPSRTKKAKNK